MPELPEVETIRRQLDGVLAGLTLEAAEVRRHSVVSGTMARAYGKRVVGVRRFGKLLIIDLSGGISLAVHLKMTGRLIFSKANGQKSSTKSEWDINYPSDKHTHVMFGFTNGSKLYFHDQRRFGWVKVMPTTSVVKLPYVARLGPEFLRNLSQPQFVGILAARRRPVKLVLMDQENIAGVGNIYANESLWCAKVHPQTRASYLNRSQAIELFACLEKILKQAIKWQGASENNYRDAFGQKGEVQEHFQAYEREGEPCARCGTLIKKLMLGGRGTYFCPHCQAG